MSQEHTGVLALCQIEATRRGWRVSRNEIGLGYLGEVIAEWDESCSTGRRHCITLANARRAKYGVFAPVQGIAESGGGFDLIGWQSLEITERQFGSRIAVFTAIDAKTAGYSRLSKGQVNFAREVGQAGGLCYIGRREGDGVGLELLGPDGKVLR